MAEAASARARASSRQRVLGYGSATDVQKRLPGAFPSRTWRLRWAPSQTPRPRRLLLFRPAPPFPRLPLPPPQARPSVAAPGSLVGARAQGGPWELRWRPVAGAWGLCRRAAAHKTKRAERPGCTTHPSQYQVPAAAPIRQPKPHPAKQHGKPQGPRYNSVKRLNRTPPSELG